MRAELFQTPYGVFSGIISSEEYPYGGLRSIRLERKNVIVTHAGELIPFYGEETLRRKNKASVTFHPNGMIKAVALEARQDLLTPIGELPAELITFYDTGEVCRVFPLDGKISGFWSEEDERALGIPLAFDLEFTRFSAILSSLCFFRSGRIKSVTLFPNELIDITCPDGSRLQARQGFSLYEDGSLQSLEPAVPAAVKTPVGTLTAFDVNAHGISADINSLRFDRNGRVIGLVTSGDKIFVTRKSDGKTYTFAPAVFKTVDDEASGLLLPLSLEFDYDNRAAVIGSSSGGSSFEFDDAYFILKNTGSDDSGSCGDCSNCSLCRR